MILPREQDSTLFLNRISAHHLRLQRSDQQRRANYQNCRQSLVFDPPRSIIGTSLFRPGDSVVRRTTRSLSEPIPCRVIEDERERVEELLEIKCNSFLHSMKNNHQCLIPPTATIVIHSSTPNTSRNVRKKFAVSAGRRKSSRQCFLAKHRPTTAQSIPRTSIQNIDVDLDLTIKSFGQTIANKASLDDKE